jgi:hypothetical protein
MFRTLNKREYEALHAMHLADHLAARLPARQG